MTAPEEPLHLFDAFGIELEYMVVDARTLSVRPIADELLKQVGGGYEREVDRGELAWSNELALHVVELKTNGPRSSLAGLGRAFQDHVEQVDTLLSPMGARLLPTAMHPWMDPDSELRLWPHEDRSIYTAFDRIFGCRGHGWANLQSMHINLPFADDDEFGRLHAAMRLVLPLLPGLAASSPYADGMRAPFLDARLDSYRKNAERVFSVSGHVIPERIFTMADYQSQLLQGIYDDLAPLDPEGVLRHEWVNARGCIARFDRMALEIRLLDVQECPAADIAIAGAVTCVVRALVEERWTDTHDQRHHAEQALASILQDAIVDADDAIVDDRAFLASLGFRRAERVRLGELWQHLVETVVASDPLYSEWEPSLSLIATEGCLARRIARAAGETPSRDRLHEVYRELSDCLSFGTLFREGP